MHNPTQTPRNADDVDLSKAKPSCPRCYGRGITSHLHAQDPAGNPIRVSVVCRCVVKRGGIRNAAFENCTLDPQAIAAKLTADYEKLSPEQRAEITQRLRASAQHANMPETARMAMNQTADNLAAMTVAQEAPDVTPLL